MLTRSYNPSRLKHLLSLSNIALSHLHGNINSTISPYQDSKNPCCKTPVHYDTPPYMKLSKQWFSSKTKQNPLQNFTREGNFHENEAKSRQICPGCGVHMQGLDPKKPGYFIVPLEKSHDYKTPICRKFVIDESQVSNLIKKGDFGDEGEGEVALGEAKEKEKEKEKELKPLVCARCHSLRHYGKVKDVSVENLLPDFDFDHTVGRKLASASGGRCVVLIVVDAADFDGSFPRKVAKLVSSTIEENMTAWKEGKSGNVPRVVLVLSKLDLIPSSVSPTRLEHWVRQRAREGGASKLTSLHMVSAVKDWGVRNLIEDVVKLAGPRGSVWAIGAQNAGKSTLINAIGKHVSGKVTHVTEAPVPGTTLGIIRLEGILPGNTKLFDTPGLLHPYHLATRLTREEQKLVHIGKELKPRTYRIMVGHSIHIAGLARLDIEDLSVNSVYVTVWASPHLPLHMGRLENAKKMLFDHFGRQLQPPIGGHRVEELGKWVRHKFQVSGNSWDVSSVDLATAGVGWFSIGIKGEATVSVWSYDGVEVVQRNALIPYRAKQFEVAGFTTSKIVSQADKASNRPEKPTKEKKKKLASESLNAEP